MTNELPEVSGRAVALMTQIARARYHWVEEGHEFAHTHLDEEAARFVESNDGGVADAISAAADRDLMGRFLRYGGTAEERAEMSNRILWQFAQALLRDGEAELSSRPGSKDDETTKDLVRHLHREVEKCGYEYSQGDLLPRGAVLTAEAEQRTLFDELLANAALPHGEEVHRYLAAAEKDLHGRDWKGVGQNVRLATDRILEDIVSIARQVRTDTADPGKGWGAMVGFLQGRGALGRVERDGQDTAETAFLKGYYRFVSVEGSHTGIPERHDAESVLRLGYFVGVHLLEKFNDWRARKFADYAPT